ncbi:hypothetical protein UA75_29185 [Actinoalloteichus sp. GBA129-24]|uniref:Uncharacterized protein n=1 Tax=Actinoalloteichus fjordicus TaxID=1612552 RepID=A0AAC9LJ05_9PSEU|nr:hypothetical protein UA74_28655 [Actinoalloteichus fjordicus]APU23808.1 hypothetical protein UA75_29185 [Actinoalloteichus sp. GBA129-24]
MRVRQVLRARQDGPDRAVAVFDGESTGTTAPTLRPLQSCRLGRVVTSDHTDLVVAELVLPHPLARGETAVLEYQLVGGGRSAAEAAAMECSRRFRHRCGSTCWRSPSTRHGCRRGFIASAPRSNQGMQAAEDHRR